MQIVFPESEFAFRDLSYRTEREKTRDHEEKIDQETPVKPAAVEVDAVIDEDVIDLLIVMEHQNDRGNEFQEIDCPVAV